MSEIIAIDGPAGSGKSTIGKILADHLNYLFVDTGVMYRAVTLAALKQGIDVEDEIEVSRLAEVIDITLQTPSEEDGRDCDVLVGGEDVTWDIRNPEVDAFVSIVSAYPAVRRTLSEKQRQIGLQGNVVMMGRDIGTIVLPDADLKIYLDASLEERANRRYQERRSRGETVEYEPILLALRERDQIDSTREVAPLKPAVDAVVIDTDGYSIEEVFMKILDLRENLSVQ
ncbi:MAG TPA: (d)CMP kinase [Anaerolineales bacterium]|nr:(d)CMP kinase [Anaerolineales bacterium]